MTEEQFKFYKNARNKAMRIVDVLNHILDEEESDEMACYEEGIRLMWFRRFCSIDISCPPDDGILNDATPDCWEPCWQERFLNDLLREETSAPDTLDEKFFEKVCKDWMSEIDYHLLHAYYLEGKDFNEFSRWTGWSRACVKQHYIRAMEQLRRPIPKMLLCYGPDYVEAFDSLNDAQSEYDKAILRRRHECSRMIASATKENREKAAKLKYYAENLSISLDSINPKANILASELERILKNTKLDSLNLSNRTYSALSRYFSQNKMSMNAENVSKLTWHTLPLGLGENGKREIIDVMKAEFGIELSAQLYKN